MRACWGSRADQRPTFSELLTRLTSLLESMADYLDFFTVSNLHSSMEDPPTTDSGTPAPQGIASTPTRSNALPPLDTATTTTAYGTPPPQGITTTPTGSIAPPSIAITPTSGDAFPAVATQRGATPVLQDITATFLQRTDSPRKGSLCLAPSTPPQKFVTPLLSRASYPALPELPNRNTI